ncbi:alpha/beta hydrolase [Paenibacillus sp. RC67]|uniref:alpha/beta fold hydrolase n=1 Tax=Paenibacillus sp. RC67 TaxID=3039392 RepID=UPI0024AC9118|nr:alpha/beta hydrolase [Paenibacillus sp. RC67]
MITVKMHDGNGIDVVTQGDGPTILIPVNPIPVEGSQADELRKWGVNPALGKSLIDGLSDKYRVVAFDYEGHVLSKAKPDTLTPNNLTRDFIAIADAVGANEFAYYGYSWLALSGLQLAIRTSRISALIMGGFPPIHGPYREMLQVTMATHGMSLDKNPKKYDTHEKIQATDEYDWSSVELIMDESQTKQFVTLYRTLQDFDDKQAQTMINCPRLCFAGSVDRIDYGEKWGNVHVDIVGPLSNHYDELKAAGWDVHILDGLDHTGAMQSVNVLPILRPWLDSKLLNY